MFGISLARISLLTGTSLGGWVGVSPTLDLNFRGQGYSATSLGGWVGVSPTLDLNFRGQGYSVYMTAYTFNQIIDFTRTSAATYVANTGFVTQTPASRNLLTYTQEFDNAAWVKTGSNAYPFDPAAAALGAEFVTKMQMWSGNANAILSVASGALRVTAIANGTAYATQAITTVPGLTYRITATYVTDAITGNAFLYAGTAAGSGDVGSLTISSTLGAHTLYFVATGTTTYISVSNSTLGLAGEYMDFDNISVSEVIGGLITAPDGTLTADALVATAGASPHRVQGSGPNGAVAGAQQVFSLYAKAGTHRYLQVNCGANAQLYANFDLLTGTVGNVGTIATAFIESAGNGWYRCGFIGTPATTTGIRATLIPSATAAFDESWTATGTESIYLWGAQIEVGSTATSYTRNFGGLFPPRFDYDPVTKAPRGLLVEEQRTNLLLRSEEFDNASWTKLNAAVTANATTSPDGTVDADFVVADTTNAQHGVYQATTAVSGATYTHSVYAKAGGYNWLYMTEGNSVTAQASFNLATGALGTVSGTGSPSATITPVGNGWYRCTMTLTPISTSQNFQCRAANANGGGSFTGDGTSGIYIWGAQIEAGSFATSYIPTVASQVTRTADVATVTGANFSRWYNQSEGTIVAEFQTVALRAGGATGHRVAVASDGSNSNVVYLYTYAAIAGGQVITGGVNQADINGGGSPANNTTIKSAIAYATNNVAVTVNGATPTTDTSVTIPTVNQLGLGSQQSTGQLNGHIRRIRYYPTRLSDAQLVSLTA